MVYRVVEHGESLSALLPAELSGYQDPRQRGLVQELSYGTLRWFHRLDAQLDQLLQRPLKKRDGDVRALLLVGLYQLLILETPAHAAVAESVEAVRTLGRHWATGLTNGVLRNAVRRSASLLETVDRQPVARWSHPQWWIERMRKDWPQHWESVLSANNERPPMVLRVNTQRLQRTDYLGMLAEAGIEAAPLDVASSAIRLQEPRSVDGLPGFRAGLVSVQDGAAQLAAFLLDLAPGQRVLDACAAPGGKTGHVLELEPGLSSLVAIDSSVERLERVRENLDRLQLQAELVAADAAEPSAWWDGRPFDRILLDAPCSASGVVRRHPDIKLLRRVGDPEALAVQQQRLLEALWPLLAPGGMILYVTCSVFSAENSNVLDAFLQRHGDAGEVALQKAPGQSTPVGRQVLPGEQDTDGFYYARIVKAPGLNS